MGIKSLFGLKNKEQKKIAKMEIESGSVVPAVDLENHPRPCDCKCHEFLPLTESQVSQNRWHGYTCPVCRAVLIIDFLIIEYDGCRNYYNMRRVGSRQRCPFGHYVYEFSDDGRWSSYKIGGREIRGWDDPIISDLRNGLTEQDRHNVKEWNRIADESGVDEVKGAFYDIISRNVVVDDRGNVLEE